MYIAGLVISILGLGVGLIPLLGWFALPLNIGAIIIGMIGVFFDKQIEGTHYQMALASLILGSIPLILKILNIINLLSIIK